MNHRYSLKFLRNALLIETKNQGGFQVMRLTSHPKKKWSMTGSLQGTCFRTLATEIKFLFPGCCGSKTRSSRRSSQLWRFWRASSGSPFTFERKQVIFYYHRGSHDAGPGIVVSINARVTAYLGAPKSWRSGAFGSFIRRRVVAKTRECAKEPAY